MRDIHDQTYYELLEIDASATQEEILKAYNRARATYGHNSPALYSLFNKEEAQELLRLIDEAYSVLSNQFRRKQYDAQSTEQEAKTDAKSDAKVDARTDARHESKADGANQVPVQAIPSAFFDKPEEMPRRPAEVKVFDEATVPVETRPASAPAPVDRSKGLGTTPFGNYKIDPAFEDEIKQAEDFSGTFIQKVRLYKNINLDQICETTKISRPYLIAVEANNFTSLPAPVFVRGFIVQIAKILGLDPVRVSNSFIKLLKEAQTK